MSNPCKLCTDWYCFRGICKARADYLKQVKRVKKVKQLVVGVNKHGIRKEWFV